MNPQNYYAKRQSRITMAKAKVITKETSKSKFGLVNKNGDVVRVSREDFMIVYRKMINDRAKKVKL